MSHRVAIAPHPRRERRVWVVWCTCGWSDEATEWSEGLRKLDAHKAP